MQPAVCIIPARGGSKRFPGKNLAELGGISLLARAIRTVLAAGVSDVIVSTDSTQIGSEARRYGAIVAQRPDHLAGDDVETWDVLRHVVNACGIDSEKTGQQVVALVQCTAPLMTPGDVRQCVARARQLPNSLCVSCVPFCGAIVDSHGRPLTFTPGTTLGQQRGQQWQIAGSVWAFTTGRLWNERQYAGHVQPVRAEHDRQCDIDHPHDLDIARRLIVGGDAEVAA